ncbi:MAG: transcriptional regulator [Thermoguttaceae bacterium]|jgi:hypothetical protein
MGIPHSKKDSVGREAAAELAELGDLIRELPPETRPRFEEAYARAVRRIERRRRILSFIQESLSQIRFDMKYLVFDLESTRKERDEYRRQLEEIK